MSQRKMTWIPKLNKKYNYETMIKKSLIYRLFFNAKNPATIENYNLLKRAKTLR